MNPITLVFGSFLVYTAIKGRLASYWALATTKAAASAQTPSNQVATLPAVTPQTVMGSTSIGSIGSVIDQNFNNNSGESVNVVIPGNQTGGFNVEGDTGGTIGVG